MGVLITAPANDLPVNFSPGNKSLYLSGELLGDVVRCGSLFEVVADFRVCGDVSGRIFFKSSSSSVSSTLRPLLWAAVLLTKDYQRNIDSKYGETDVRSSRPLLILELSSLLDSGRTG